jgi:hypothetical protein
MTLKAELREIKIINSIRTAGFLSTEQVRRLHFKGTNAFAGDYASYRAVTGVLKRIREDWGAVECLRFPRNWGFDCGALHVLNASWEKARLISEYDHISKGERRKIARRTNQKYKQLMRLVHSQYKHALHHYAVNDSWIWLQRLPKYVRIQQRFELHCTRKFGEAIPDAVMQLFFPAIRVRPETTCFIEVDRNTERYEVLYDKFVRYKSILTSRKTLLLFIEQHRSRNLSKVMHAAAAAGIANHLLVTNLEDAMSGHWLEDNIRLSDSGDIYVLLDWLH